MRGQTSVEMLVLVSAILISVSSMLYWGMGSNESAVVLAGARDGAENAIFTINMEYGCSTDVERVSVSKGIVTIEVNVRNAPPPGYSWDNFSENVVENIIRDQALKYIRYSFSGYFPEAADLVKGTYATYDVEVVAERVVK